MLILKGIGGGRISDFKVWLIADRSKADLQSQDIIDFAFRQNLDIQSQNIVDFAFRQNTDVQSQNVLDFAFRCSTQFKFNA